MKYKTHDYFVDKLLDCVDENSGGVVWNGSPVQGGETSASDAATEGGTLRSQTPDQTPRTEQTAQSVFLYHKH